MAKKHKRKYVLWSDDHLVFVIHRVDEWIISTCVVPTVKHGGGSVMVWRCFAGDTFSDLFRVQGTLNQHGYHSILQLSGTIICFSAGQ